MNKGMASKLESLQKSSFRAKFSLSERDMAYIREKGLKTIKAHATDFIASRIAPRFAKNDGKQTPMKGHPAFIAQHATATCCRNCIQKWHGIQKGKVLSNGETEFLVDLVMAWIQSQMEK